MTEKPFTQNHLQDLDGVTVPPAYRDFSTSSSSSSMRLTAPWGDSIYAGFSFTLLDTLAGYYPLFNIPDCPVIGADGYSEPSTFDWLLVSNQPCFSAAFDADGNYCYSLLHGDGAANSHPTLLDDARIEATGVMAYYPVAPF